MVPAGHVTFRFDSKFVFLTYAQSPLTTQQVYDGLTTVRPIKWARICQEDHADGGHHQHVVAEFDTRLQSRNERVFDILGQHPNIQKLRSVKAGLTYVAKDGEFQDYGPVPATALETNWLAVASECDEGEYFVKAFKAGVNFQFAQKFWQLACKNSCEIGVDYEADMSRERAHIQPLVPADGSTIVVGPTGIGKTSWAKRTSKKPALWVRHIDVLRSFRKGYHESIIFDDMDFQHMPRQTQLYLTDTTDEGHIHCRYGHAVIPAGVQRIFTANNYPFIRDPAIDRRVTIYHLLN